MQDVVWRRLGVPEKRAADDRRESWSAFHRYLLHKSIGSLPTGLTSCGHLEEATNGRPLTWSKQHR